MSRVSRLVLTVCFAIVFFVGRYAVVPEGARNTDVGSAYTLVGFASQLPSLPVAGADIEELTGKARVCLSMLNTFLRRYKKRPITSAATSSARANSAHMRTVKDSEQFESCS
jgi:hypothetical protein